MTKSHKTSNELMFMKSKILLVYGEKCLLYVTMNLFESFFVSRIKLVLLLMSYES